MATVPTAYRAVAESHPVAYQMQVYHHGMSRGIGGDTGAPEGAFKAATRATSQRS